MPSYGSEVLASITIDEQEEISGKSPLSVSALMKPGALNDGTSTTWPSKTPRPFWTENVPVDRPPITGSFISVNLCDVDSAPSKVTNVIDDDAAEGNVARAVTAAARTRMISFFLLRM